MRGSLACGILYGEFSMRAETPERQSVQRRRFIFRVISERRRQQRPCRLICISILDISMPNPARFLAHPAERFRSFKRTLSREGTVEIKREREREREGGRERENL